MNDHEQLTSLSIDTAFLKAVFTIDVEDGFGLIYLQQRVRKLAFLLVFQKAEATKRKDHSPFERTS